MCWKFVILLGIMVRDLIFNIMIVLNFIEKDGIDKL